VVAVIAVTPDELEAIVNRTEALRDVATRGWTDRLGTGGSVTFSAFCKQILADVPVLVAEIADLTRELENMQNWENQHDR
jgi:hypothetical protein